MLHCIADSQIANVYDHVSARLFRNLVVLKHTSCISSTVHPFVLALLAMGKQAPVPQKPAQPVASDAAKRREPPAQLRIGANDGKWKRLTLSLAWAIVQGRKSEARRLAHLLKKA